MWHGCSEHESLPSNMCIWASSSSLCVWDFWESNILQLQEHWCWKRHAKVIPAGLQHCCSYRFLIWTTHGIGFGVGLGLGWELGLLLGLRESNIGLAQASLPRFDSQQPHGNWSMYDLHEEAMQQNGNISVSGAEDVTPSPLAFQGIFVWLARLVLWT